MWPWNLVYRQIRGTLRCLSLDTDFSQHLIILLCVFPDLIGEGAFSQVFRGSYLASEVAIKRLKVPLLAQDKNYFMAEVIYSKFFTLMFDSSLWDIGMLHIKWVNIMLDDALAPDVARPSSALIWPWNKDTIFSILIINFNTCVILMYNDNI